MNQPNETLLRAVESNDIEVVKSALEGGANLEVRGPLYDGTPLLIAIGCGHEKIAHLLVEHGADVLARNDYGATLSKAAFQGWVWLVQRALENGADVNSSDDWNHTPMMAAAKGGKLNAMELLLENGADIHWKSDYDGGTALGQAVFWNYIDAARWLIERGANIEECFEAFFVGAEWPPFAAASGKNSVPMMKMLLAHGAKMRTSIALDCAATQGALDAMRFLLELDDSIDLNHPSNKRIFSSAIFYGNIEAIEVLVEHGAKYDVNISHRGWHGNTHLHLSVRHAKTHIINWLLEHGADINIRNDEGKTPLQIALDNGHFEIAERLSAAGATE